MSTQIQILNMGVFQHKHKKVDSIFKKILVMEASILPMIFYELKLKFEKL
jgi:hypothetical protein